MPNVLSDLIWVQTDCVNVISRRTVARKLNASCADNKNTIITPLHTSMTATLSSQPLVRISADGKMWLTDRKLKWSGRAKT